MTWNSPTLKPRMRNKRIIKTRSSASASTLELKLHLEAKDGQNQIQTVTETLTESLTQMMRTIMTKTGEASQSQLTAKA